MYGPSATADPKDWFREFEERNVETWIDLRIGDQLVTILRRGPRI